VVAGVAAPPLGCATEAADLAHDTFVRLISGHTPKRFDSGAEARAYLRTTAQNLCINLWRRQEIEQAWLDTLASAPEAQYTRPPSCRSWCCRPWKRSATCCKPCRPRPPASTLAVVYEMTDDEVGAELGRLRPHGAQVRRSGHARVARRCARTRRWPSCGRNRRTDPPPMTQAASGATAAPPSRAVLE